MFKGQILFAAPVLLLRSVIAGWPGKFICILSGAGGGAGSDRFAVAAQQSVGTALCDRRDRRRR